MLAAQGHFSAAAGAGVTATGEPSRNGEDAQTEPFGSQRRPARSGEHLRVQVIGSHAMATISHQSWFWA